MSNSGFLLVDKPAGFTSHDVVAKVRKALGTKKVGHAGTLDPMATGLLVVGVNSGTKLLTFAVGLDKTYLATIRLGAATVTDDAEGEYTFRGERQAVLNLTDQRIREEIAVLTGTISQVPSSVSAIKVAGVRSYDRVRSGEEVKLAFREVTVSRFEILEIRRIENFIDVDVLVDCSSGTYIRALARDLGSALQVGGHLTCLRRTQVGKFSVENATAIDQLADSELIELTHACEMLMPTIEISDSDALALRQGKQIDGEATQVLGAVCAGSLIAVLEKAKFSKLKSVVVFAGGSDD